MGPEVGPGPVRCIRVGPRNYVFDTVKFRVVTVMYLCPWNEPNGSVICIGILVERAVFEFGLGLDYFDNAELRLSNNQNRSQTFIGPGPDRK